MNTAKKRKTGLRDNCNFKVGLPTDSGKKWEIHTAKYEIFMKVVC